MRGFIRPVLPKLIAVLVLISTCTAMIFTLVSCSSDRFDFMNENLSKYVKISEEDYRGYTVTVNIKEPGDMELEERIIQALVREKSSTPRYNGNYMTIYPIEAGSVVKIRYRGYTLDEDGNKIDIPGTSNLGDGADASLEIGSGKFVSGFEYSLIGKNMADYSLLTTRTDGTVKRGDIITVAFNAYMPDGTIAAERSVVVDTTTDAMDQRYGEGFTESFIGKEIGGEAFQFVTSFDGGSAVYADVSVNSKIERTVTVREGAFALGDTVKVKYTARSSEGKEREQTITVTVSEDHKAKYGESLGTLVNQLTAGGSVGDEYPLSVTTEVGAVYSNLVVVGKQVREDRPMTVTVRFPHDYDNELMRNMEVFFDVYVSGVCFYDVPTLTEEFINDTLKISDEELSLYDGDDAVQRYRNLVKADLKREYEEAKSLLVEEALFEHLVSVATYKKLPKKELEIVKKGYYSEAEAYYETYPDSFSSVDDAGALLYELETPEQFKKYVQDNAERDVKERLVFYYIGRKEDFFSDKKTVEKKYDEELSRVFADYLIESGCTRDKYKSDEEYQDAVEYHREEMLEHYLTPEMIYESIYYAEAMPKLLDLINIEVG